MKMKRWMPFAMIGVMLLVMVGVMAMFGLMLGDINPMAMMFSSSGDMWTFMLVPIMGFIVMVVIMFLGFRWMTSSKGPMSLMMGTREAPKFASEQKEQDTMTFHVPDVNCAHCKMKIENEVGNLPGVTSVEVDIEAKQAVVKLISPPTKMEIETLLTEIGYPPDPQ